METYYVNTPTLESYSALLVWCEENGILWADGTRATSQERYWTDYESRMCVEINYLHTKKQCLTYGSTTSSERLGRTVRSLEEFFSLVCPSASLPPNWPF